MGMFHIGNLDHQKVIASLDLFKKEVMPQLAPSPPIRVT